MHISHPPVDPVALAWEPWLAGSWIGFRPGTVQPTGELKQPVNAAGELVARGGDSQAY